MSSPQKENGYTPIANEIMEALAKYRIPGEQRQCLDVIIRKTYGFQKKSDMISNSQFVELTGLKKGNVSRAVRALVDRNLVIKTDNRRVPSYEFNKRYTTWKVLSKMQPVIKDATSVIKDATFDNKSDGHKRNYTKETSTKERTPYIPQFDAFWSVWPKKVSKGQAIRAWNKMQKANQLPTIEILTKAIAEQIKSEKWTKNGGQFIPNPSTWLNALGWLDQLKVNPLDGVVSDKTQRTISNLNGVELT